MPLTEHDQYQLSLKYERDLKNVIDYAREEGKKESLIQVAQKALKEGMDVSLIAKLTELNEEFIQTLKP